MCRSIKTLHGWEPRATDEEVRAAALQFVRKISGMNKPSKVNEAAFLAAVEDVAGISSRLLGTLHAPRGLRRGLIRERGEATSRRTALSAVQNSSLATCECKAAF